MVDVDPLALDAERGESVTLRGEVLGVGGAAAVPVVVSSHPMAAPTALGPGTLGDDPALRVAWRCPSGSGVGLEIRGTTNTQRRTTSTAPCTTAETGCTATAARALAFQGRKTAILCPYDVAGLDPAVVADATATHPTLVQDGRTWSSPDYAPQRILSDYNLPLPEAPHPTVLAFDSPRLALARRSAAGHARDAGIDVGRIDDVKLAVGELAANSLRHGGGSGVLRMWTEADHWVCEVQDAGWITDPLAGRRPAAHTQLRGRGLLMVNNLADLVRTYNRPGATTIRAYFHL